MNLPVVHRHVYINSATHPVALPYVEADDLLIALVVADAGSDLTTPTDWTRFDSNDGTIIEGGAFWLVCDGTETANVDFLPATAQFVIVQLWHVPAGIRDVTADPEAVTSGYTATGQPTFTTLTPSWGSALVAWFVGLARNDDDGISALGANYADTFVYDTQTIDELASAWRTTTAASESPADPTTATTNEAWKSWTVGVKLDEDDDITGTGSSTLEDVESDGSGTYTPPPITGTGASTLGDVTSAGSGTFTPPGITGTGASTLAGVTSAGVGVYTPQAITGTGSSTLGDVTSVGAGTLISPITGTGTSTLADVTSSGVGVFAAAGDIDNVVCDVTGLDGVCDEFAPVGACTDLAPLVTCGVL